MGDDYERVAARHGQVYCPMTGRLELCTFVEDLDREEFLGVASCTRFSPPEQVQCDERCVDMLNAGYDLDGDGDG